MKSQVNQDFRSLKIKGNEKYSQHKKIKKFQILAKYSSLFHQKNLQNKDFIYLNRQNSITSVNLRELPKTLQAYYSVNSSIAGHSCETILSSLAASAFNRESFISIDELPPHEKFRSKNNLGGKGQSFKVLQSDIAQKNE
jgi:hypothetical protein